MVDRVHGHAANLGAVAKPAVAPGLADGDVLVHHVADLANRGEAGSQHVADFARGQTKQRVLAFLGHQLGVGSGSPAQLSAASGIELDVVQKRSNRNLFKLERIAGFDVRAVASSDHIPDVDPNRRQNVTLFTVGVMQKRNTRATVGVILDREDRGRNAEFVALEVNDAVQALVAAAATT